MSPLDNYDIIKRVYTIIKQRVIQCDFPEGERLNIEQVAEELRVSTTPVREILNHLVAEELIVKLPRMGFFMKNFSEPEIHDLYELNLVLLDWALGVIIERRSAGIKNSEDPSVRSLSEDEQLEPGTAGWAVVIAANLFADLAYQSGNKAISDRVSNINDRLHYIRLREFELYQPAVAEIISMLQYYREGNFVGLRQQLRNYHDNCASRLSDMLKNLRTSQPHNYQGHMK